jgi:LysR family glycine cleavage system transcriptional activator
LFNTEILLITFGFGMSLTLVQLSSLDQIRGFVAVGRRMSITLAAQDLCLTQSAVSRQIQTLEDQLGTKLLVRSHRSIAFTPAGELLFRSADTAVQQLQNVMGDISAAKTERPVLLSASVGVTGLWLLSRLNRFQELYPDVDLRLSADNRIGDLKNDGVDLAIRYTTAALAPAGATWLFGESVVPVSHPDLMEQWREGGGIASDCALIEYDVLHHSWLQWGGWFDSPDWEKSRPNGIIHFNQYDQVIQAALAGQGVALGRLELIQPLVDAGRLVILESPRGSVATSHAYWLLEANERPRPEVRHVANWVKAEASATEQWRVGLQSST